MLISVFNGQKTPFYSWSQDFKENVTIPRNAVIQLIRAFLPLKTEIEIGGSEEERTLKLLANDESGTAFETQLTAGKYTANELALACNDLLRTLAENYTNVGTAITHNEGKGLEAGAVRLIAECNDNIPNILAYLNTSVDPVLTSKSIINKPAVITQCVPYENYLGGSGYQHLGLVTLTDGADANVSSFQWALDLKQDLDKTFFVAPLPPTLSAVIPTPSYTDPTGDSLPFGAFSWIHNADTDYCFAFSSDETQGLDFTTVGTGVGGYVQYKNCNIVMAYRSAQPGNNNQKIGLYEDSGTGLALVNPSLGNAPTINSGDRVAMTYAINKNVEYYYQPGATGDWLPLPLDDLVLRAPILEDTEVVPTFSQFTANTTNDATAPAKEIVGGFEYQTTEDYGEFIKVEWGTSIASGLGFSKLSYEAKETGAGDLAKIDELSDDRMSGTTIRPKHPYVNIAIENLPARSWANTTIGSDGLGSSKVIGTASRYDTNGNNLNVSAGDALVNLIPEPEIRLNNADQITLNRLDFRFTNADGTLAEDLDGEQGLVLSIKPSPQ